MTFNDFVQIELPKRPFAENDGSPGQVLARSSRPERPRELVWADLPGVEAPFSLAAGPDGVSGHRAIMVLADGTAAHADPAQAWAYVGISMHAAEPSAQVDIALRDTIGELSWSWVPGQIIYFAADGMLTQTVPVATAVTPIGVALSATSILISRDAPVFLQGD
jgi:hypothetical protein